jgi:hypothetical protein
LGKLDKNNYIITIYDIHIHLQNQDKIRMLSILKTQ